MKVIGFVFILSALVMGIAPQFLDCQSQGKTIELPNGRLIPMKCHWTAQAEIAMAMPLLAVGGLIWFNRRQETRRVLSILGVLLGVFAILIPTYLIGVCSGYEMLCNSVMKPTLIFTGTLSALAGVVGLALTSRNEASISSGAAA